MANYSQVSSTAKAVKAVNALIPFCEEDQQSLLDIITDYFDDNEKRGQYLKNNNNNNVYFYKVIMMVNL